ncbi:MAG TPA: DUF4157 domain-containing protein [Methanosarcina sp.]|nr:DUF4157 domain-containing protein [Methanosarcina sp.]
MVEKTGVKARTQETKQKCSNSCKQNTSYIPSVSPADRILQLQRTVGNQAVQRLIRSGTSQAKSRTLQAKLRIGQPDDIYEQEADRVAEQVMRMPGPQVSEGRQVRMKTSNHILNNSLQLRCPKCIKNNPKKEEEEGTLQKKKGSSPIFEGTPELEFDISNSRSGGQPLTESVRAFYEPRFGHDFSQVRVHTDSKAVQMNRDLQAQAFTYKKDIYYGGGKAPDKNELTAHELTHVVQQSAESNYQTTIEPKNNEHKQTAYSTARGSINLQGKIQPTDSWAHRLIVQQIDPGNHGILNSAQKVSGTRLQKKSELDDEIADTHSSGNAIKVGTGGNETPKMSECPRVPTGLGNISPDPLCPKATHAGTNELKRFNFCLDSDKLDPPEQLEGLNSIIRDNHPSTRFLIHGYASPEGDPAYNFRLACHRANKISKALEPLLGEQVRTRLLDQKPNLEEDQVNAEIKAEIQSRIETASQGPTNKFGASEFNRVALVYGQIPGGEKPMEPSCAEAPRHVGDIKPEIPCDEPTIDLKNMSGSPQLGHFHFCLDSDVLASVNPSSIEKFAHRQAASANFVVHGFASIEGKADYNKRLSCHRALRVARELINVGVRPEQIREVSGLGGTDVFGDAEFNRVTVVLAERGKINHLKDGPKPADTFRQKEVIRDEARDRLMSGQYNMAADAYISHWTCGRTATIRQAVERLKILLPKDNKNELLRDEANGTEESLGVNTIRLSNVALRADNPVECTMGRIIDMAFHHAVLGDLDLGRELSTPLDLNIKGLDVKAEYKKMELRHKAGLHLAHLAGFSACMGRHASAKHVPGRGSTGIDEPLNDDPLANMPSPLCVKAPQPSRLLPPVKDAKDRQAPDFLIFEKNYALNNGTLSQVDIDIKEATLSHTTKTENNVINASASVSLLGKPDVFPDYEIGFIQTILDDLMLAEYITGHYVLEKLPVPIRAAEVKGGVPVPPPWTSLTAMKRPDANGQVSVNASWKFNTEFATYLTYFRPPGTERPDRLDTWQRHTNVAIWLVARRLGAPLDRFNVHFLDGITYDVTQNFDVDIRRVRGSLEMRESDLPDQEHEHSIGTGYFRVSEKSQDQADSLLAQFDKPVAGEIDLNRHISKILLPEISKSGVGLEIEEFKQVVQQILDNLVVFGSEEGMLKGEESTHMSRLGFVFNDLFVTVPIDRRIGRIGGGHGTSIKSPGMGSFALFNLQKALNLRLQKRDFLKQGRSVVLKPEAIKSLPGTADIAELAWTIPRSLEEPVLKNDKMIMRDLAVMWACAESQDPLNQFELGILYWMDRDGMLHRFPDVGLIKGNPETPEGFHTAFPSDPDITHPAGFTIGTAHTHPPHSSVVFAPSGPSSQDLENAKKGLTGRQHFVVDQDGVTAYFSDSSIEFKGKSVLPSGVKCDDKDLSPSHKP